MNISRVVCGFLFISGLLAGRAIAAPSAAQDTWDREFSVYSSSSALLAVRYRAYRHLRVLDSTANVPRPRRKAGLVFASTSTVSGLITKSRGGVVVRRDKARVVVLANACPADFTVTLSSPGGYHPLEETLK